MKRKRLYVCIRHLYSLSRETMPDRVENAQAGSAETQI